MKRRKPKVDEDKMLKFFKALLKAYESLNREEQRRIHKAIGIMLKIDEAKP